MMGRCVLHELITGPLLSSPRHVRISNAEEMKKFVSQWLPHKQRIPDQRLQEEFVSEVVEAYLRHTEQSRAKGELHLWFDLLQVKARKL